MKKKFIPYIIIATILIIILVIVFFWQRNIALNNAIQENTLLEYEAVLNELDMGNVDADFQELDALVNQI